MIATRPRRAGGQFGTAGLPGSRINSIKLFRDPVVLWWRRRIVRRRGEPEEGDSDEIGNGRDRIDGS